jgi:type I restriction enzyme S subunit
MTSYPKVLLRDICEAVEYGYTASSSTAPIGPRFLRITDIVPGRLDWAGVPFCAIDKKKLAKHRLRNGDIVIARTGATTGWAKYIANPPEAVFASYLVRIQPNESVDSRYIGFVVESQVYKDFIQHHMGGAAQPNANAQVLTSFEIPLPPLPIQRRIAGILSAYDDLIENSQRRIKILEEMARRLYREWFVHFRFPGHEGCTFVESPLGEIPEGWEVKRLGDVTTKIGSGATPKGGKGAYKTEGIHLIRSLNIYDYSFQFDNLACINEDQAAGLDNVRVQQNDVLLNITGASVARCAMVPSYLLPARVNQHVAIIRADEAKVSPHYLLDAINSDYHKQKLLSYAQGGATREALTKETISGFEIVVPPTLVMSRYAGVASGIHLNRETLTRQIQNLRRTRDLLLPRLLSGQIEVEALPEPALQEVG